MSGTLPTWLERWLGLADRPGEGTAWRLDSSWPWPPWVTLLFLVVAAALVVTIYLREGRQAGRAYRLMLATIRLGLVGLLLAMIAQFALSFQRTGLPYVAVLLDDSLSMTIVDRYTDKEAESLKQRMKKADVSGGELTRWNLAKALLAEHRGELLSGLSGNHKLRFYFLTSGRSSQRTGGPTVEDVPGILKEVKDAQPVGSSTRLGDGVRKILDDLRGATPAAVILLTDGINTEGPSLAEAAVAARRKGVPLFLVGLGSGEPVRNLKLSDLLVDKVVFVNDIVNFEFKLTGTGFQGTKVPIVLREEGKPDVLAKIEVAVGPDGQSQTVRLPYRPTNEGEFRFVIEAAPQPGEQQTDDNRLERTVQVRKEKIRVLLVQAYPSFEYRYLRNVLGRDETIDLNTVLQDADVEYAERDKDDSQNPRHKGPKALPVFPVERDKLFAYDVIILGDVNPALLGPGSLQNLADFVDQPGKGGALVLLAGPKYMPQAFRDTPLARLMPFDIAGLRYPDPNKPLDEGFHVEPTEQGLSSPAMQLGDTPEETRELWKNLPPLYWIVEIPDVKAARVLAENPRRLAADGRRLPVIILQQVGAGKVLFHATDETWRWRRRLGDVLFARYWVQTLRYLWRSKVSDGGRAAALSTDRDDGKYNLGDAVRFRLRFGDERLAPAADNGVTVLLKTGRKEQHVTLQRSEAGRGLFEAALSGLPVGAYHASLAAPAVPGPTPAADFQINAPPGEFVRVEMDATEMRRAAEITKGRYYTLADADRLLADLPEGRQVAIETLPPWPLWNKWPVLGLFLLLLVGEWLLRKRGGMI